jgi:hypothetical protein
MQQYRVTNQKIARDSTSVEDLKPTALCSWWLKFTDFGWMLCAKQVWTRASLTRASYSRIDWRDFLPWDQYHSKLCASDDRRNERLLQFLRIFWWFISMLFQAMCLLTFLSMMSMQNLD